ncbi:MAG: tetratricopeptide repeat protein [Paenisporosarcina sp.]
MQQELEQALKLREERKLEDSNSVLMKLVHTFPNDAFINYQCAWSFDVMGEELKALPFYEKAIDLGLLGEDLEGAIIGLGSTYRTLGQYEKSHDIFLKGLELYPNNKAIKVFFSMTSYNLHNHSQAMEILLNCLVETSSDQEINKYKKAITFYADKLDETWD